MCVVQGTLHAIHLAEMTDVQRLLAKPVVVDPLGKLYNKDAVIEFFLDRSKYGDGDRICGHLKGVKVCAPEQVMNC